MSRRKFSQIWLPTRYESKTWENPFVCLATQLLKEVWQFEISFPRVLMNLCHFLHEKPFFNKSKPFFSFWKFGNFLPKRKFTIASFNVGGYQCCKCLSRSRTSCAKDISSAPFFEPSFVDIYVFRECCQTRRW